jgi:hypothetical protein
MGYEKGICTPRNQLLGQTALAVLASFDAKEIVNVSSFGGRAKADVK